jgi:hypothetical protein
MTEFINDEDHVRNYNFNISAKVFGTGRKAVLFLTFYRD